MLALAGATPEQVEASLTDEDKQLVHGKHIEALRLLGENRRAGLKPAGLGDFLATVAQQSGKSAMSAPQTVDGPAPKRLLPPTLRDVVMY